MQICTIVGARPQFIKAAVVSQELRSVGEELLVHTGQHYDDAMSSVFFEELDIPEPEYNLGVKSGPHGEQTANMITAIEPIVEEHEPDVLLLYGDTNSTLAGAIVGSKCDVAVAHVEAGLRSDNREMPEEINRILTDHAADLCFAPSTSAVDRLAAEGITDDVYCSGDVMYDAILAGRERAMVSSEILDDLGLEAGEFVLATVHRESNTDVRANLAAILDGLAGSPQPVVFPAHPRTIASLEAYDLIGRARREFELIEPLGYLDFIRLMDAAERIATDSGGVQKEAFFLGTPCVTLRNETEWTETVDSGWNVLVGPDTDRIRTELQADRTPETDVQPYGDGDASRRIASVLAAYVADGEPAAQFEPEPSPLT